MRETKFVVYVLLSCDAKRTYVGVTNDPVRRLEQHNGLLPGGAKATRGFRPWRMAAQHGPFATRGEALGVERRLKDRSGLRRLHVATTELLASDADPSRGVGETRRRNRRGSA